MKLKLAALLSFIVFALAGCNAADTNKTANTNAAAPTTAANNSAAPATTTTAQNNPNIIEANADPTESTGGTKEGCKCSAVGMSCNNKEGEKGCCGGKDGTCSTKKAGVSKCCSPDKDAKCCSVAKMTASTENGGKDAGSKTETAPAAPAKKS